MNANSTKMTTRKHSKCYVSQRCCSIIDKKANQIQTFLHPVFLSVEEDQQ